MGSVEVESWRKFEARLRGEGRWEAYQGRVSQLRVLKKELGFRTRSGAGPTKLAAVEMGWLSSDRGLVLDDLCELMTQAKQPFVFDGPKADEGGDGGEKGEKGKKGSRVLKVDLGGRASDSLIELARRVGSRTAPVGECIEWVVNHGILPIEELNPDEVPGSACVPFLEMFKDQGGRFAVLKLYMTRLAGQELAKIESMRADLGMDVREELMAFSRPGFCAEGVAESGLVELPEGVGSVTSGPGSDRGSVESFTGSG